MQGESREISVEILTKIILKDQNESKVSKSTTICWYVWFYYILKRGNRKMQ